jgi:hypothetical protein
MSSIQTDEESLTVESLEPQLESEIMAQGDETPANPRSFSASIKRTLHRFVRWIDSIDRDGQEYWN